MLSSVHVLLLASFLLLLDWGWNVCWSNHTCFVVWDSEKLLFAISETKMQPIFARRAFRNKNDRSNPPAYLTKNQDSAPFTATFDWVFLSNHEGNNKKMQMFLASSFRNTKPCMNSAIFTILSSIACFDYRRSWYFKILAHVRRMYACTHVLRAWGQRTSFCHRSRRWKRKWKWKKKG